MKTLTIQTFRFLIVLVLASNFVSCDKDETKEINEDLFDLAADTILLYEVQTEEGVTKYAYNNNKQLLSETFIDIDNNEDITKYIYNDKGLLIRRESISSTGEAWYNSYPYNSNNKISSYIITNSINPNDTNLFIYEYDSNNTLVSSYFYMHNKFLYKDSIVRNDDGLIIKVLCIAESGTTISIEQEYDEEGNVTYLKRYNGGNYQILHYEHDNKINPEYKLYKKLGVNNYQWSPHKRNITKITTDNSEESTTYSYEYNEYGYPVSSKCNTDNSLKTFIY